MRRVRSLIVAIALVIVVPMLAAGPAGAASSAGSYARTDFTAVTPANAILFATLQSTSATQARTLNQIAGRITAQPGLQSLLGSLFGLGNNQNGSGNMQQILPLLTSTLGHIFNGELGLAVLPAGRGAATTSPPTTSPPPAPRLHLLLDAGLQPGITAEQLRIGTALLGIGGTTQSSYRGLAISTIDLTTLLRTVAGLTGSTTSAPNSIIPATVPISGTLYLAVAGDDAVFASDLPSLKSAIDTYAKVKQSIAVVESFIETVALLPAEHFATLYLQLDTSWLRQLAESLSNAGAATSLLGPGGSTASLAFSLTAQPHALLLTTSSQLGAITVPILRL